MVAETTMKPVPSRSIEGMVEGLGSFSENLLSLATLQAQLAATDARESAARAMPAAIALGVAVPILVASTIVLLAAVALELARATGASLSAALFLTALLGACLAAALAVLALKQGRKSLEAFRRSREELERNVAWIRTVLVHSGR
jgi:hypothetical protein